MLGTIEGPIIGALVYFALRETLADHGTWYIVTLGVTAIGVMMVAPAGLWGLFARRTGVRLFPAGLVLHWAGDGRSGGRSATPGARGSQPARASAGPASVPAPGASGPS